MDDPGKNVAPEFEIPDQIEEEDSDNLSGNGSAEEKETNPNIELFAADRKRKAAATVQVLAYGLNCSVEEKRKRKVVQARKKLLDRPVGWSPFGLPGWDSAKTRTDSRAIIKDLVKTIPLPYQAKDKAEVRGRRNKGKRSIEIPQGGKLKSAASVGTYDHSSLTTRGAPTPVLDVPVDVSTEISFAEFNEFFSPTEFACAETLATVAEVPILYNPEGAVAEDPICYNQGGDYEEARNRLSAILSLDFDHLLLDPDTLARTLHLSTALKENAGFNPFQLAMLKMVEEIPLLSDDIVEFKDLNMEIKTLFSELESNILRVACSWTKYRDSIITLSDLQVDVSANLYAARMLDHQILQLQTRRVELANLLESKKNAMIELISAQTKIAGTLPKTSDDEQVEAADLKKPGGSAKKKPIIDNWAKILDGFFPLKDFIF
ncbi:uncharacterized protein LOC100265622 [Vitis vinifera]|nr:uncharacterized protein LOC100265622 [Vitis vinifera]|eukprot:XP_010663445.1 PREDICTED: uncharacterized protein LOC100265622 [Vitis vinifera]